MLGSLSHRISHSSATTSSLFTSFALQSTASTMTRLHPRYRQKSDKAAKATGVAAVKVKGKGKKTAKRTSISMTTFDSLASLSTPAAKKKGSPKISKEISIDRVLHAHPLAAARQKTKKASGQRRTKLVAVPPMTTLAKIAAVAPPKSPGAVKKASVARKKIPLPLNNCSHKKKKYAVSVKVRE